MLVVASMSRKKRNRGDVPRPDYENKDPFRGLPASFPPIHSRFPSTFPPGALGHDDDEDPIISDADRDAWREVMNEILSRVPRNKR